MKWFLLVASFIISVNINAQEWRQIAISNLSVKDVNILNTNIYILTYNGEIYMMPVEYCDDSAILWTKIGRIGNKDFLEVTNECESLAYKSADSSCCKEIDFIYNAAKYVVTSSTSRKPSSYTPASPIYSPTPYGEVVTGQRPAQYSPGYDYTTYQRTKVSNADQFIILDGVDDGRNKIELPLKGNYMQRDLCTEEYFYDGPNIGSVDFYEVWLGCVREVVCVNVNSDNDNHSLFVITGPQYGWRDIPHLIIKYNDLNFDRIIRVPHDIPFDNEIKIYDGIKNNLKFCNLIFINPGGRNYNSNYTRLHEKAYIFNLQSLKFKRIKEKLIWDYFINGNYLNILSDDKIIHQYLGDKKMSTTPISLSKFNIEKDDIKIAGIWSFEKLICIKTIDRKLFISIIK